jgi:hypothetical protein
MSNISKLLTLLLFLSLSPWACEQKYALDPNKLAIVNAHLLDLSDLGKSDKDVPSAYILIDAEKIVEVGEMPENWDFGNRTIIDAKGKTVIPGLTDGFAAINNQSYANAYLYSGVTDIVSVSGGRRGVFFGDGLPSPNIKILDGIGAQKITDEDLISGIDSLNEAGISVLLLMYKLTSDQLKIANERAIQNGQVTIGELGFATYEQGMDIGLDAFVHTTRYSLDAAPREMVEEVAKYPFSNALQSPKWLYYKYLSKLSIEDELLVTHAARLGKSETFIQPTLSLLYLDMELSTNPWDEKVASIINAEDVDAPANKTTGKHDYEKDVQDAYSAIAQNVLNIEALYYNNGARYLAGSAADVWGTMPGISLHTELKLLSEIGLTNREVLAATTENFNVAYGWFQGKIEKNFSANLLILEQNPLENLEHLKNINTLILNGKVIDREGLLKE